MLIPTLALLASLFAAPPAPPPSPPASPPPTPPVNTCDSLIIAQTRTALADLAASASTHAGDAPLPFTAIYQGACDVEAHMMRPGMTYSIPIRLEIVADSSRRAMSIRETSGADAAAQTQTSLILLGRFVDQPRADRPFVESAPDAAPASIADAAAWLPAAVVAAARDAAPSCRPGPTLAIDNKPATPITFTDVAGRANTILLDSSHRVVRVERLAADPRLGDVCNWTSFGDWTTSDGAAVPRRIARFIVLPDVTLRYDLTLVSYSPAPVPPGAFDIPEPRRSDIPTWGQPPVPLASVDSSPSAAPNAPAAPNDLPAPGVEIINIAPSVWCIEAPAASDRVLVVEREHDLVTLGAPDGDAVSTTIIAALKARFPDKPIALAAFSHHHPASCGGLRAFAAAGATILLPSGLEPFVRDFLTRPTTLGGPAVAAPSPLKLQTFDHDTTIEGAGVRLLDIGEQSRHAFHYVVFYFPAERLLFEDDLGYFPTNAAPRLNPRLAGLAAALDAAHIEPERLIQAWPIKNAEREIPWSIIADLVHSAKAR